MCHQININEVIKMGKRTDALLESEREYQTKVYTDFDAEMSMQTLPSRMLAQVIKGEIDLNALAKVILANRGQDQNGNWVGFDKAKQIHAI